jgi:hypothetical protein
VGIRMEMNAFTEELKTTCPFEQFFWNNVEFLIVGSSIGASKYHSTITNHFRIWKRCVAVVVAVLFLQQQDHLRLRDCNGGKKGNMWGMVRWLDYKARMMSVRGREGRKKQKVQLSHNRAQLFLNHTIMCFAGICLLVVTPSWGPTVGKC